MPQFITNFNPEYGNMVQISPLIRRIVADNPSLYTFKGTGTYIIGKKGGSIAIIDPGPLLPSHLKNLKNHLSGENITHILITHNHSDHSPAAKEISAFFKAKIYAFNPKITLQKAAAKDQGIDREFTADFFLKDGDVIKSPDWTLKAIHTPGHISNHLCFALEQEAALFTGDHVMGWSTSVIIPPDGHMGDYFTSLEKLTLRNDNIYYPTHGAPITQPKVFVDQLLKHRRKREAEIIFLLKNSPHSVKEIVAVIYKEIPQPLHIIAEKSILAHLILLVENEMVTALKANEQGNILYRLN